MLLHYIKLSFRLMARNPLFTFIKVGGLAVGLAMFIVLWQYSRSELNSDRQWKDNDRIYRLGSIARWTDDKVNWVESPFATNVASLSDQIVSQYPDITEITRILFQRNFTAPTKETSYVGDHGNDLFLSVSSGSEKRSFKETGIVYADPNVFSFFGIPLLEGDPETALDMAGSIVLSETLAIKYFGTTQALGKSILLNDQIALSVEGVFNNLPKNTHLAFDAVISNERIRNRYPQAGPVLAPIHYVKTEEGVDIAALSKRINADMHPQIKKAYFGDWVYGDGTVYCQPLTQMAFQSYIQDDYTARSRFILRTFQGASIAILLLVWINYTNLTGASNLKRIREVATRRVIGSKASELMAQFLVEASIANLIALLLALTLVQLVKTPVEMLLGFYVLPWERLIASTLWILVVVFAGGVLLTGIYPAWVIMNKSPTGLAGMMRHNFKKETSATLFTTIQYTVAITIVILSLAIRNQMTFLLSRDMGFNKDEIVIVDLPLNRSSSFKGELTAFLDKIREMQPAVSRAVPGDINTGQINLIQPGVGAGIGVIGEGGVDENFLPLYGIKLIEGRNFLTDHPADSASILLSEITANRIGFESAADAIGRKVLAGINGREFSVTIVGVYEEYDPRPLIDMGFYQSSGTALTYKDFLFAHEPWSVPQKVSFRIHPDNFQEILTKIESAYRNAYADPIFNWYFLDAVLDRRYHQYHLASNQIMTFSLLAVSLACLGLLGMMIHRIHGKVKEIGIRKVLGAEFYEVAQLLLGTTFRQILFSSVLGIPAAYYLTQQYLEKFTARIELQWWHFALPIMMLVTIMLITVASVVWKATKNNPVDALKCE